MSKEVPHFDLRRDILAQLPVELIRGFSDPKVRIPFDGGTAIDARECQLGSVFVALQGTNTHGLNFVDQAMANGASCVLVGNDAPQELLDALSGNDCVAYSESRGGVELFGCFARRWRDLCDYRVCAITGSSGKTTTKEFLAALIPDVWRVRASTANNNNEIGVPLTLTNATLEDSVVICEMGMRGSGQIQYLCDIAQPDVSIITNIGSAHIGLLGSREAIRAAKGEIISGTKEGGTVVLPSRELELLSFAKRLDRNVVTFGETGDVSFGAVERSNRGLAATINAYGQSFEIELAASGEHNLHNAAAAIAANIVISGSIQTCWMSEAFEDLSLIDGRGALTELPDGTDIVDDAYNANPESMAAAITTLAGSAKRPRIAILGHMAELGEHSADAHRAIGEWCAKSEIEQLIVVHTHEDCAQIVAGFRAAGGEHVHEYSSANELMADVPTWYQPGATIVVKASNSAGLSVVAAALRQVPT